MTNNIQQKLNARWAARRKSAVRRQKSMDKTKIKTSQTHKVDKDIIDYMEFKSELRRGR